MGQRQRFQRLDPDALHQPEDLSPGFVGLQPGVGGPRLGKRASPVPGFRVGPIVGKDVERPEDVGLQERGVGRSAKRRHGLSRRLRIVIVQVAGRRQSGGQMHDAEVFRCLGDPHPVVRRRSLVTDQDLQPAGREEAVLLEEFLCHARCSPLAVALQRPREDEGRLVMARPCLHVHERDLGVDDRVAVS